MEITTQDWIRRSLDTKQRLLDSNEVLTVFQDMVTDILQSLSQGGRIFFAGNGGSAADAQHLAAELSVRYKTNRIALPGIALGSNFSHITAAANDFGFDAVFARQIEAEGSEGDILIALTTSGNSENILKAVSQGRKMNLTTFAWTGDSGGKVKALAHKTLRIPSDQVPRIQECHMLMGHILCEYIDAAFTS